MFPAPEIKETVPENVHGIASFIPEIGVMIMVTSP
jgi:hypothetical protein